MFGSTIKSLISEQTGEVAVVDHETPLSVEMYNGPFENVPTSMVSPCAANPMANLLSSSGSETIAHVPVADEYFCVPEKVVPNNYMAGEVR